jgi:hypothetical protein
METEKRKEENGKYADSDLLNTINKLCSQEDFIRKWAAWGLWYQSDSRNFTLFLGF